MAEKIEIFGKVLELDDARLLDIIIHNGVKEIAAEVAYETEELFTNGKSVETMLAMSDTIIQGLMGKGLLECKEFLKEIGVEDVENKEIFVTTQGNYFIEEWGAFEEEYIRAKALNDESAIKRLQRVYKSRDFIKKMGQAMYMDVYDWIPNIEILLRERNIPLREITVKDEEKGVGLFKLLKQNPSYDLAYRLLETDPTEQDYYEYCIVKFPEQMEALVLLERCVGCEPPKDVLEKGLQALFEKMPHDTEEQTLLLKVKLEEIRAKVGISESDTIKKVDKMLYQFDLEARTFQNIEFATRELRKKAEEDYLELSKVCEGVEQFDENNCVQHREAICKKDYVQEIANMFIKKIDDRKITIWKEEDAVKIEQIFLNTNINDEKSIQNSVSEIESIGRTDDKMNYINALTGMNNENKELFTKFHEWKDKKFIRKYLIQVILWFAGVVSMFSGMGILVIIIAVVFTIFKARKTSKMKKAWELLTLNGKLVHPQLLSGQNIESKNEDKIEIKEDKMFCRSCGKEINSSDSFCKYCGTKIEK